MLSSDELKQLTEYQVEVFKDVFFTKEDAKGMQVGISNIQRTLDAVLKEKTTAEQERIVANRRIKDLEDFADKAAPKLGIKFEH